MTIILVIVAIVVAVVGAIGYLLTVLDLVERLAKFWRHHVLKTPDPAPATAEDISDLKSQLVDLQRGILATALPGVAAIDTTPLATNATPHTAKARR